MKPDMPANPNAMPAPMASRLIEILMRDRPCWRVTRVLGSMLVFDFGERRTVTTRGGKTLEVGADQLSIRNVQWVATGAKAGRVTSDTLDRDRTVRLHEAFSGACLEGCQRKGRRLSLRFTGDLQISLDLTNLYEVDADEQIAELRTERGWALSVSPEGVFELRRSELIFDSRAAA